LGLQPLSENYLKPEQLNQIEAFYPLHVYFCENCFLVQLDESVSPQKIFNEYAYFSSSSRGWIKHIETYAEMIVDKLGLGNASQVVEIGSNDGYLLQFFASKGIPVLGVEPAANVAGEAIKKGIPTIVNFFGREISKELIKQDKQADLLIGNNILAQVPDINGFVEGLANLLKPSGVITLEFHHLLNLIDKNQFDTISHERFSYFSFFIVEKILASHGLTVFDVEELSTHGGSLRVYARHSEDVSKDITPNVSKVKKREQAVGLTKTEKYLMFSEKVKETKRSILDLLIKLRRNRKSIVGYGAHAEAHTLLNYCCITSDFLEYTVDRNPDKQGKFIAGVHIPIFHPDKIEETKPDYVVVLPWNIKGEIMNQLSYISRWGGRFILLIPETKMYNLKINLKG
jgi:2-polyprenyl-3-methyl-5-hydroxy-6-metoxy-1,4-benzoquinol methylase